MESNRLIVSIWCLCYNHEQYIRDCLNGFIMQKTSFPFEAIVHDDASTDHSADIIREYAEKYPNIIKPIYEKENQYSKADGSLDRILQKSCVGKYIAICEGDDYWTDPYKLQKQVDFLEQNVDYGLCYTNVQRIIAKTNKLEEIWGGPSETFEELLMCNSIPAMSAVYRRNLLLDYYRNVKPNITWRMGDYPIWLYIASKTKIKYLPFVSGCYRILDNSASHSTNFIKQMEFRRSANEVSLFFMNSNHISTRKKYIKQTILLQIDYIIAMAKCDKKETKRIKKELKKRIGPKLSIKQNIKTLLLICCPAISVRLLINK